MKEVRCYLCDADEGKDLFCQEFEDPYINLIDPELNKVPRKWKVCRKCGFIYRSPRITDEEERILYRNYGDNVFKSESPDDYFDRITAIPLTQSENHRKATWLKQSLLDIEEGFFKKDRLYILDVGCGGGTLLYSVNKVFGAENFYYGVDCSPIYANLAKKRLNARIEVKNYKNNIFGRKFDLIICAKVLEHIQDPGEFIEFMSKDLDAGGFLFLEVPDINDIFRLNPDHSRLSIPHHYFFSINTLRALLAKHNFQICVHQVVVLREARSYLQVVAKHAGDMVELEPPFYSYYEILKKCSRR